MKTTDLTPGERLLILRRREKKGQREFAEEYGITLYCYRQLELDQECRYAPPDVMLHDVHPYEVCFIRRTRAGITLTEFARTLGVSRWWLCEMEYGNANFAAFDRLVAYWEDADKPRRAKKRKA